MFINSMHSLFDSFKAYKNKKMYWVLDFYTECSEIYIISIINKTEKKFFMKYEKISNTNQINKPQPKIKTKPKIDWMKFFEESKNIMTNKEIIDFLKTKNIIISSQILGPKLATTFQRSIIKNKKGWYIKIKS